LGTFSVELKENFPFSMEVPGLASSVPSLRV
jgi:hypothetical protein